MVVVRGMGYELWTHGQGQGHRYAAAEVEAGEQKDWSRAEEFYRLAADLFPEGKPPLRPTTLPEMLECR